MEYLVVVIDAAGVRSGRVIPNKEILTEQGYLVLEHKRTTLSPEEAATIRSTSQDFDFSSGPVEALLVRKAGGYDRMRQIQDTHLDNTYSSVDTWTTLRDKRIFFPTTPQLERTVVLVKPEYSQDDYTRILETIDNNDFVLIGKLARIVSPEIASAMYNESEEHIAYLTSDVSVALVIEKVGAVDDWQLLMGPDDPSIAAVVAPDTLRGSLSNTQSLVKNVLYGSESVEKAQRDIAALFPVAFAMERTLAIVKPDVVANGQLDVVMQIIKQNGFTILASVEMNLSQRRAEQFYGQVPSAVTRYMSSGTSKVMVLGKPGAVVAWQKLMGPVDPADACQTKPDSLIARFGADTLMNGFHASASADAATKEIDFFFPQMAVEKLPSLVEVEDALNKKPEPRVHVGEQAKSLQDVLVDGLTNLCREKPTGTEAITWLAEWLLKNNPNKPQVEEPVVELPSVGVLDQIAATTGQAVEVVWALGGPGSGRDENVATLSDSFGYEVVDTASLLAASESSGSEYGELIKDCKSKGRAVPTFVPVNLVKDAMLNAKNVSKFIIKGFPSTMDQAVMFEKVVGEATKIVYFDCTDATKASRINTGDDEIAAQLKAFKTNVYPIVDQYQLYGKVKKISTDGAAKQVQSKMKKIFT